MIVICNVRYRNGRCRQLYSKDGGKTLYLDRDCTVVANPKHITSA